MTQYLYPQNLKATANLWLWGLRDFCILGIAALLSIVALVQLRIVIPCRRHALLWIFDHPSGRYDHTGFYEICRAVLYIHTTILRMEVTGTWQRKRNRRKRKKDARCRT